MFATTGKCSKCENIHFTCTSTYKLQENEIDWLSTWLNKSLIIEAVIRISETRKLVNNKLEL